MDKKAMEELHIKSMPHKLVYETEEDLIEVRPTGWELYIKEKDTGEEYSDEFDTKQEAENAMLEEIKKLEDETDEEDDEMISQIAASILNKD